MEESLMKPAQEQSMIASVLYVMDLGGFRDEFTKGIFYAIE